MNTNQVLTLTAAVQVALVAWAWWPRQHAATEAHDLVDLPGAIDRIEITGRAQPGQDPPEVAIDLRKKDGTWVLANVHDYPADPEKVEELLDRVGEITVRVPVAENPAHHGALNVADGDFARKVVLGSGDAEVALFIGAASGQQAHVRRADASEVYAVKGWNAWAIPDRPNRVWRSKLVDLDPDTVDSFTVHHETTGEGFTLEKSDGRWTAAGQDVAIDQTEVGALLRRLNNLHLSEVVGRRDLDPVDTHVAWTAVVDDESVSGGLKVGAEHDGKIDVQVDGRPFVVAIPSTNIIKWRDLTLDQLVAEEEAEEEGAE